VATLGAWRFDSTAGADRAADILLDLAERDDVLLLDAATVVWETGKRTPRTRELFPDATRPGVLGGGFWGLLFGVVFFVPLLGAAIGAATGATAGPLADVGIDDGFVNQVRDQVTPGTSALFLLTSEVVVTRVHHAFAAGPAGDLIRTDLSPEQESALREVFCD
jgi:uncharacterized membrane protein